MSYENLKEDAQTIWAMGKELLADGISASDVLRVTEMVTVGVVGLVRVLADTTPDEKQEFGVRLIDDFYAVEIRPLKLLPWPAAEEILDDTFGRVVHLAAVAAMDAMLDD